MSLGAQIVLAVFSVLSIYNTLQVLLLWSTVAQLERRR